MKNFNNKGSALLQVLVLGALIITIVTVLIRFSITRTSNMMQTKTLVGSNVAVEACLSMLNEEEARRVSAGAKSYFDDGNEYFLCSVEGYEIQLNRDSNPGDSSDTSVYYNDELSNKISRQLQITVKVTE